MTIRMRWASLVIFMVVAVPAQAQLDGLGEQLADGIDEWFQCDASNWDRRIEAAWETYQHCMGREWQPGESWAEYHALVWSDTCGHHVNKRCRQQEVRWCRLKDQRQQWLDDCRDRLRQERQRERERAEQERAAKAQMERYIRDRDSHLNRESVQRNREADFQRSRAQAGDDRMAAARRRLSEPRAKLSASAKAELEGASLRSRHVPVGPRDTRSEEGPGDRHRARGFLDDLHDAFDHGRSSAKRQAKQLARRALPTWVDSQGVLQRGYHFDWKGVRYPSPFQPVHHHLSTLLTGGAVFQAHKPLFYLRSVEDAALAFTRPSSVRGSASNAGQPPTPVRGTWNGGSAER